MDFESEYTSYFSEFFENAKEKFRTSIGFKEADELSSGELAFRDAINSLPCPICVITHLRQFKIKTIAVDHPYFRVCS